MLHYADRLAQSRRSDRVDAAQARNHAQPARSRRPRRAARLDAANRLRAGRGQRLLYVSNQHGRHEEADRLHRRSRPARHRLRGDQLGRRRGREPQRNVDM